MVTKPGLGAASTREHARGGCHQPGAPCTDLSDSARQRPNTDLRARLVHAVNSIRVSTSSIRERKNKFATTPLRDQVRGWNAEATDNNYTVDVHADTLQPRKIKNPCMNLYLLWYVCCGFIPSTTEHMWRVIISRAT
jgi:hypothetical protein